GVCAGPCGPVAAPHSRRATTARPRARNFAALSGASTGGIQTRTAPYGADAAGAQPGARTDDPSQPVVDCHRRLVAGPGRLRENAKNRFHRIEALLRVLGPEATLRRGYSITTDQQGKIIRTVTVVRPGIKIRTRLYDGEFSSETL